MTCVSSGMNNLKCNSAAAKQMMSDKFDSRIDGAFFSGIYCRSLREIWGGRPRIQRTIRTTNIKA
jgi:hypothetical protein